MVQTVLIMQQVPLFLPFALASFFAIFGTTLFTGVKLLAFSPFLALLYHRTRFQTSLWIASLCGLIVDLLSSEFLLGMHALNYCITTFILYKQKRHFFEEKPLALSLFTLIISIVSTILQLLLIAIFDRPLAISLKLVLTDLIVMPALDAIYAFVWFSCTLTLYLHIKKIGWRTFCSKIVKKFRLLKKSE
jgi:rod shape-determining protein MreD